MMQEQTNIHALCKSVHDVSSQVFYQLNNIWVALTKIAIYAFKFDTNKLSLHNADIA